MLFRKALGTRPSAPETTAKPRPIHQKAARKPDLPVEASSPWEKDLRHCFASPSLILSYISKLIISSNEGSLSSEAPPLARLPPTVFSELLRSLDPIAALSKVDPIGDIRVSGGMAQFLVLGEYLDHWGIRKLYVLVFKRLLLAARLRIHLGPGLRYSDWKILLRCAGAASDPMGAKGVWHMMLKVGQQGLRNGELFEEFVKARFLTERLYRQNDMARFRVRPVDLNRQKLLLPRENADRLRWLNRNKLKADWHYFGQNRAAGDTSEHMMRIMRKMTPIVRLATVAERNPRFTPSEGLASALMIAYSRTGSLRMLEERVLEPHWGITVDRRAPSQVTVKSDNDGHRKPLSPLRLPTGNSIEAIVDVYCSNAEVVTALMVADLISSKYGVPIPHRTWFNLLEWAYILSTNPASTEWKYAGWPAKIIRPSTVQLIWNTMTSERYNIQPGYRQHFVLIKSLIPTGKSSTTVFKKALRRTLDLLPLYHELLVELENTFKKHTLIQLMNIEPTGAKERQKYLRLRAKKEEMWYFFMTTFRALLKSYHSYDLSDQITTRRIPNLIRDYRGFMPNTVKYYVATGTVEIANIHPVIRTRFKRWTATRPRFVTGDLAPVNKKYVFEPGKMARWIEPQPIWKWKGHTRRVDVEQFVRDKAVPADDLWAELT
ncbi:hypothetical protein OQA88_5256 [Cercophora sp. LCS_1]